MFREMHHVDHNFRAMDLAQKMKERRRQSLAANGRPFSRPRLTRMHFGVAMTTVSPQAEGRE